MSPARATVQTLESLRQDLDRLVEAHERLYRTGQSILHLTKIQQPFQQSFNLQYLQLQSQMQDENRSFTFISNIMKTKHATAPYAIASPQRQQRVLPERLRICCRRHVSHFNAPSRSGNYADPWTITRDRSFTTGFGLALMMQIGAVGLPKAAGA